MCPQSEAALPRALAAVTGTGSAPAVAVVGAGWSGLSAALALAEAGLRVTLFESAPQAGGRARTVELQTPFGRIAIDNGQHLMVGAYRQTLELVARLGTAALLQRSPLHLQSAAGLSLRAARLPAPLHLGWGVLQAEGLDLRERAAIAWMIVRLRRARWQAGATETVSGLLARYGQPRRLVERLWAPLCVGALNTVPADACARTFAAVLRDTLGADRAASDFVAATAPLGALLPAPALSRLRALGASIRLRTTVRAIAADGPGWRIEPEGNRFAALLLALPPWSAARLVAPLGLDAAPLREFAAEPIATAWAFWRAGAAPRLPRWRLLDEDPVRHHYGQWIFDRGVIGQAHVAGVVVSVASRLAGQPPDSVARGIAEQLRESLGEPGPAAVRVVTERRATFHCTPARPRLRCDHYTRQAPGLWLAGDWLWPDYPATLESAVRSGQQAARAMIASFGAAAAGA